jgi:flavodoxin
MNAYVVYDTKFGNTEQVARAIGTALQDYYTVRVASVTELNPRAVVGTDLLVVGAPTQQHGLSPAMREWLHGFEHGSLRGVPAAAFDTRYHKARWLTGSAAARTAVRLRRAGCRLVTAPESFFVERHEDSSGEKTELLLGELERVGAWVGTFAAVPAAAVGG